MHSTLFSQRFQNKKKISLSHFTFLGCSTSRSHFYCTLMMPSNSIKVNTEVAVLVSAFAASLATYVLMNARRKVKIVMSQDENIESTSLGPESKLETQYQLNLRGKVDRIYEYHGPKPFEFNSEVVSVFDDMVSRSVPLYCEVIDLCIYWFQRYYQPGSRVYDLGCSTGTTLDILARAASSFHKHPEKRCEFVGIDNSEAMVQACKEKLDWATKNHIIDIRCGDILGSRIENASFVVMNYTLQFVPVVRRQELLSSISKGLLDGGILFLSEKVRTECSELQETCTWIYEDFKERRKYTKREIARKKEALMNVLIPFSEKELKDALHSSGFENVEITAKWNNFTTFVARKKAPVLLEASSKKKKEKYTQKISTPNIDKLFDACPVYLGDYLEPKLLSAVCLERIQAFRDKGVVSNDTLKEYDGIAEMILALPQLSSKTMIFDQAEVILGHPDELNSQQMEIFHKCINSLKPWRKGPVKLFGVKIDSEWRSDLKWERIKKSIPNLKDKVICDLGCGNGYFMYRMLEFSPKLIVGIDPNFHAWLEFNLFQRISGIDNVKFEYLRGDILSNLPDMFDVIFCLGVLYHTPDPIGMLKDIHKSMTKHSTLIVDCQGIPGDEHIALFPKKRYTNMKGVYFLPTLITLQHWLQRANFKDFEVIFNEELSTEEQRTTEWAPVRSLKDSLAEDERKTIEGYPRAHRFYVKVRK